MLTAETSEMPVTGTGRGRSVVVPSPSVPRSLSPQQYSSASRTAHVLSPLEAMDSNSSLPVEDPPELLGAVVDDPATGAVPGPDPDPLRAIAAPTTPTTRTICPRRACPRAAATT